MSDDAYDNPYEAPKAPLVNPSPALVGGTPRIASVWQRLGAFVLDLLIVWLPCYMGCAFVLASLRFAVPDLPRYSAGGPLVLVFILFCGIFAPILIFAASDAFASGSTPGKRILGIRVIDQRGGKISFLRAFIRNVLKIATNMAYGIGGMAAFFGNPKGRTLHDRMCRTMVVRVPKPWEITLAELAAANNVVEQPSNEG